MIIQTRTRKPWLTWLAALVAIAAFFALISFANSSAEERVEMARLDAELPQIDTEMERLGEVGRIAKAAHAQGMSEAISAVKGTADGEAFERSCARLWAGQQP